MFEKLKMKAALKNAEKIQADRDKITKVIAVEEKRLLKLIAGRVEADTALVAASTAAALNEPCDVDGARQRSTDALVAIGRQASMLGGLRVRLASQAPELEAGVRGIQSGLPEHLDGLRQEFAADWRKGVSAFGALLGKRKALEALVGKVDLPEPQPVAVELGDASAPWRAIETLRAGLEEIAGWGRADSWPAVDAMGPRGARHFDQLAVYTMTRAYDNLSAGSLVMEPCFSPGTLAHLVNIGDAISLNSQQWAAGLEAGATAARELEAETQAKLQAAAAGPTAPPMTAAELAIARDAAAHNKAHFAPHPDRAGRVTI